MCSPKIYFTLKCIIAYAAALAEKIEQSTDSDVENLKLLKEAIINCRQNEAYLRIIHVNNSTFFATL